MTLRLALMRWRGVLLASLLVVVPLLQVGAAQLPTDQDLEPASGTAPEFDGVNGDPWMAAEQALQIYEEQAGTARAQGSMVDTAGAALDFARLVSEEDVSAVEILAAVAPLIQAQGEMTRALDRERDPPLDGHAASLEVAQASVAQAESANGEFNLEEVFGLAAFGRGSSDANEDGHGGLDLAEFAVALEGAGDRAALVAQALELKQIGAQPEADEAEMVRAALAIWQMPEPRNELPPMPGFDSLRSAVESLYDRHGYEPSDDELAAMDALDNGTQRTASALKQIVEAHLFMAEADRVAFQEVDREALADAGPDDKTAVRRIDIGLLMQAQATASPIVAQAAQGLECSTGATNYVSPVFQYDLACEQSEYNENALLLIDVGGDDLYRNNGGGASLGAAMLVDVRGNDTYAGSTSAGDGRNGGAFAGSGFLLDLAGDDSYSMDTTSAGTSWVGANGGGNAGSGFLLDHAGNDTYRVNITTDVSSGVGANGGGRLGGSGFLLDLAGNDAYSVDVTSGGSSSVGANGGSHQGSGFLLELKGDDFYSVNVTSTGLSFFVGANGGGVMGSGSLIDHAGNDVYSENVSSTRDSFVSANGSGVLGSGFLLDLAGNDVYKVDITSTWNNFFGSNGGGVLGTGFLLDLAGDDVYSENITNLGSSNVGANGGGVMGSGLLLDHAGNDTYSENVTSTGNNNVGANGGGVMGSGSLMDHAGNDSYHVDIMSTQDSFVGANGGGYVGSGSLLDQAGNDSYSVDITSGGQSVVGANGGGFLGSGFLLDLADNDSYRVNISSGEDTQVGANGGGVLGSGFLLDLAGSNAFTSNAESINGDIVGGTQGGAGGWSLLNIGGDELPIGLPGGLGILIAGSGDNTYTSSGNVTQGAGDLYGLGILVDLGGNNTYTATPSTNSTALAQGSGRHGGTGTLIDLGLGSSFTLTDDMDGQGAGLQGVGLLARLNDQGTTTYSAPSPDSVLSSDGGGIGLRIERALPQGTLPDLECSSPEAESLDLAPTAHFHVCEPDPDTKRDIINPLTGNPTGEATDGGLSLVIGSAGISANPPWPASCHPWSCMMSARAILPGSIT